MDKNPFPTVPASSQAVLIMHDISPGQEHTAPTERVETLQDLLGVIENRERRHLYAMLRATAAHISMCCGRPPHLITLKELPSLRKTFSGYMWERHEKGDCMRNTARTNVNNFGILAQKAKQYGTSEPSSDVSKLWRGIRAAISREYGSLDIVRDAVEKGISPKDYSEQHLNSWCDKMAKSGRHPAYIRDRMKAFRKRILEAGLSGLLPKLSFNGRKQNYGVPLEKFPEPLRTQVTSVLAWKQAPYVRGRPNRYRCRPITVLGLKQLFCEIVGFAKLVLSKLPQTLADLVCEEIISKFTEWRLQERGVDPLTVIDDLRMIPPLGRHPLLKDHDFKWLREIVSDVPPHVTAKVKERKQRKFVRFEVLLKIPGQLLNKASAATNIKKKAILTRDALLIGFLLILVWRQRNIRECRLGPSSAGGNIFKEEIPPMSTMALPESVEKARRVNPNAAFWQFSFNSDGTKSKRSVRAVLPCQLVPILERYLLIRQVLLGANGADPGTLFLNNHGKPLTTGILRRHVVGVTSRHAGKCVNPHLFRDIHAEWWLRSGRSLDALANNLWHRDPSFTREVYGGMYDESHGTRDIEDCLGDTNLEDVNDSE